MTRDEILAKLKVNSGQEFGFLTRHFVSLAGSYRALDAAGLQTGEAMPFVYSGWVIAFGSAWCLVTAGHILAELDEKLILKKIDLTGCVLIDTFGTDAQSTMHIPFVYKTAPRFHVLDAQAGLDFGLIALSAYYAGLLQ